MLDLQNCARNVQNGRCHTLKEYEMRVQVTEFAEPEKVGRRQAK